MGDMENLLRADRDRLKAELMEAQHIIGILLDRAGGTVTLTDEENVRVQRNRKISVFRREEDHAVVIKID
jgi:hypothetical protein